MHNTIEHAANGTRFSVLRPASDATGMQWRFAWYPPHARISPHRHELVHFSVMLAGHALEETSRGEVHARPMQTELKPINFRHANRFGPHGALLLSISIDPDSDGLHDELPLQKWQTDDGRQLHMEWLRLTQYLAGSGERCPLELEARTIDLLATFAGEEQQRSLGDPPAWLRRARDAVIETDESVQSIAVAAGVHRVHLARAFQDFFGQSMTQLRRQLRVSHAVQLLLADRRDISRTSLDAGFADQPHLTRTLSRELGLTPSVLRAQFTG